MLNKGVMLALVLLGLQPVTSAVADDVLGAVMRDTGGQVSTHTQAATDAQCQQFLQLFRTSRAAGKEMELTMRDPYFKGVVLVPFCIQPDGTAMGADGPIKLK